MNKFENVCKIDRKNKKKNDDVKTNIYRSILWNTILEIVQNVFQSQDPKLKIKSFMKQLIGKFTRFQTFRKPSKSVPIPYLCVSVLPILKSANISSRPEHFWIIYRVYDVIYLHNNMNLWTTGRSRKVIGRL